MPVMTCMDLRIARSPRGSVKYQNGALTASAIRSTTRRGRRRPRPPDGQGASNDAYLVVMAGSNVGEMYKLEKDRWSSAAATRPTSG